MWMVSPEAIRDDKLKSRDWRGFWLSEPRGTVYTRCQAGPDEL